MGLFVKRQTTVTSPLYKVGNEKTKLIVGLGNIGKQYQATRHNAGFLVLDHLADLQGEKWKNKASLKVNIAEIRMADTRVILIKPTTLMNLSGQAVQATKQFYKIDNKDILVVHDELDLLFGTIRVRLGGSSGGHNGVKSVSGLVGEDYYRLRIGIAHESTKGVDSADFVLKNFSAKEQVNLAPMLSEANAIITEFIYSDNLAPDTRKFI